jgi:hypothetical protein
MTNTTNDDEAEFTGTNLDRRTDVAGEIKAMLTTPDAPAGERERFEAWARQGPANLSRLDSGPYISSVVSFAWRAWQARASAAPAVQPVAITAKMIEWGEQRSRSGDVKEWHENRYGFYIARDDEEEEPYGAAWGEGDTERFKTLEEAQAWCQAEIDRWVSSCAVVATQAQTEG